MKFIITLTISTLIFAPITYTAHGAKLQRSQSENLLTHSRKQKKQSMQVRPKFLTELQAEAARRTLASTVGPIDSVYNESFNTTNNSQHNNNGTCILL